MITRSTLKNFFASASSAFVLATLVVSALFPLKASASEGADKNWQLKSIQFSKTLTLKPRGDGKDLLTFSPGESMELRSGLTSEELKASGLSEAEGQVLSEMKREVVLGTLRATLSDDFSGLMVLNQNEGYSITPSQAYTRGKTFVRFNPIVQLLQSPEPGETADGGKVARSKFMARLKAFAKFLNEAIILSTYREYKSYKQHVKEVSPHIDEFGLSLNFKIELQLGVGSFNFSKSGALLLDIGYNRHSHKISLRTGLRKEGLGDGIAFPAVKVEVRAYEMTTGGAASAQPSQGHAWYPPSLPALSLVLDSSDRYMAQGIAFSLNAGDFLIPGGFLMNTVNSFQETEKRVTLFRIPEKVFTFFEAAIDVLLRRPRSCEAVFR